MMNSDEIRTDDPAGSDESESAGVDPIEQAAHGKPEEVGAAAQGDEVAQLKDRYLRLAAEYDNFRKRTDRERSGGRDRAQAEMAEALLEPLDDLQRVADLKAESTTVEAVLEGIQMVERKLLRILEGFGLETLDAHGKAFDPSMHEALMTIATDDASEDDTVGEVFQPGYQFRGTLVRPARVQVRKHGG